MANEPLDLKNHRIAESGAYDAPRQFLINESEDQIRSLKASESVTAAFAGHGLPAPPTGLADIIASFVKAETRAIKIGDIRNMTPGSGSLGASAATGVNLYLSMLTPTQREMAKAGLNPMDASALSKFEAALRAGASQIGATASSGSRYAALKDGTASKDSSPSMAQLTILGKLSGGEFASRLGFTGDQAREFGALFTGTSGTFRSAALDYNRIANDPNATDAERRAAAERMEREAKTKREKEAARKLIEAKEKLKSAGVDLSDTNAVSDFKAGHSSVQQALDTFKRQVDEKIVASPQSVSNKAIDVQVAAVAAKAPESKKAAKPTTIQSTL